MTEVHNHEGNAMPENEDKQTIVLMDSQLGRSIVAMDSAYDVDSRNTGKDVCVNASYCGVLPARFISDHAPRAAIGMDCGIGPEGSAIAGLWFLEALNIPAAVADVMSAHLGTGYIYTNMGLLAFVINSQRLWCTNWHDSERSRQLITNR